MSVERGYEERGHKKEEKGKGTEVEEKKKERERKNEGVWIRRRTKDWIRRGTYRQTDKTMVGGEIEQAGGSSGVRAGRGKGGRRKGDLLSALLGKLGGGVG
jgi:hypothetical protein